MKVVAMAHHRKISVNIGMVVSTIAFCAMTTASHAEALTDGAGDGTHNLSAHAVRSSERPIEGWSGSLSVGVGAMPTYEGSANRIALIVPGFSLAYRDKRLGLFEMGADGFSWTFLESDTHRFALLATGDGGRKERKERSGRFLPRMGDDRLAGMGDIKATTYLGFLASGDFAGLSGEIAIRKAISSDGHRGTQVDFGVVIPIPLSDKTSLTFGPKLTWSDAKYMSAYFGVTPTQETRSRFAAFNAQAGIQKVTFDLGLDTKLGPTWTWQGGIAMSRLTGDAARSPISEKNAQISVFTAIIYGF